MHSAGQQREGDSHTPGFMEEVTGWLSVGRRRLYAGAAAVVAAALLVASFLPESGSISLSKVEALIDANYHTQGAHCRPSSHGRYLCTVRSTECTGSLLVAPVSGNSFSIVNATFNPLHEAECEKGESVAGEAE